MGSEFKTGIGGIILMVLGFIALPIEFQFAAQAMNSEYTSQFTGAAGVITLAVIVATFGVVATGAAITFKAFRGTGGT